MPYQFIRELPQLIQDRIYLEEHTPFFDKLFANGILPQDKGGDVYDILDSILLRQESVENLSKLLMSKIGITQENVERASAELWRGYLLCFQDYLGTTGKPELQGIQKSEEETFVRSLFGVHRQLQDVIAPILYELDLSESDSQCKDKLKDILIALATKTTSEGELKAKLGDILLKYKYTSVSVDTVFETFSGFIKNEFTVEVADYYLSLPDSILNAKKHSLLRKQIAQSEEKLIKQSQPEAKKEESLRDRALKLPKEIIESVTSLSAIEQRAKISKKYDLELEDILYAIALKEIPFDHIALALRKQRDIKPELVAQIRDEIIKTFFEPVMWYFTGEQKPGTEVVRPETKKEEKQDVSFPQRLESNDQTFIPATGSRIESGMTEEKAAPQHFDTYEELANLVIQKCITGLNEECRTRVQRALITRIRNIRTNIETAEKLIDAQKTGGCGITPEIAERAVKEAALLAQAIQEKSIFVGPQMPIETAVEQPIEMPIEPEQKKQKVEEVPQPPPLIERSTVLPVPPPQIPFESPSTAIPKIQSKPEPVLVSPPPPPPPVQASQTPATLAIEEVDGIPTLVEKSFIPPAAHAQTAPQPLSPLQPVQKQEAQALKVEVRKTLSTQADSKKLTISDIKKAPHLVGPIEELQTFSLKDFRRISANPSQAANRIFDKIQSIEKESLPKKMEAIAAWKKSEVNQMYIEIGKESFGKGVPIAQAIEQRKNAGKEYLSEQEFDALLDLSTMLRS